MSITDVFQRLLNRLSFKRRSSETEPDEPNPKQRKLQSSYFADMDFVNPAAQRYPASSFHSQDAVDRAQHSNISTQSLRQSTLPAFSKRKTNGFLLLDDDAEFVNEDVLADTLSRVQAERTQQAAASRSSKKMPPPPLVRMSTQFSRPAIPSLRAITGHSRSTYGMQTASDYDHQGYTRSLCGNSGILPAQPSWNNSGISLRRLITTSEDNHATTSYADVVRNSGSGQMAKKIPKSRPISSFVSILDKQPQPSNYNQYKGLLDRMKCMHDFRTGFIAKNPARLDTKPTEIIDLVDTQKNDDTLSGLNNLNLNETNTVFEPPKLPPVNSLQSKLDATPEFNTSYLEEVNQRYSNRKKVTQEQIEFANKTAQKQQQEAQKHEKIYKKRQLGEWLVPDSPIIVLDAEEAEPVEEFNDFPSFSPEQTKQLEHFMRPYPSTEGLITKFSITITRQDVQTLEGLSWLNDEVINFYMNLLTERSTLRENYPKVHAFSTFFLTRLSSSGYAGVRRWTRKVDIFAFDIIPVPVHVGGVHWCMAIIDFRHKTIRYYDSMLSQNPKVLKMLADYLCEESRDKKGVPYDLGGWKYESMIDIPRQNNQSDCGVFSCSFAETITRNRPVLFTQQNMPYIRQKMVLEICTGKLLL